MPRLPPSREEAAGPGPDKVLGRLLIVSVSSATRAWRLSISIMSPSILDSCSFLWSFACSNNERTSPVYRISQAFSIGVASHCAVSILAHCRSLSQRFHPCHLDVRGQRWVGGVLVGVDGAPDKVSCDHEDSFHCVTLVSLSIFSICRGLLLLVLLGFSRQGARSAGAPHLAC